MPIHEDIPKSSQLFLKLRYVFIPILITSVLSIVILTALHWYLDYELNIVDISTDSLYWILILFVLIIWALFMRKRINLFVTKKWNDNGLLHFIVAASLFVPLLIAQHYLVERTASLVEVENFNAISQIRDGDYIKVQDYVLNRRAISSFYNVHTIGRNNTDVVLNAHFVIPVESQNSKYQFWITKKKTKKYGTREYKNNQDELWEKFHKGKVEKITNFDPFKYKYLKVLPPSDTRVLFNSATNYSPIYARVKDKAQLFLEPVNDDYSRRYQGEEKWFLITFIGFHFVFFIILLFLPIHEGRLKKFLNNEATIEDIEIKEFLTYLIPRGRNFITPSIILINILVFIIMAFSGVSIVNPLTKDLMEFGALRYQEVMQGEYWRLLTAGFIHIGIIHLFMNIFVLGITGAMVEMTMSRWRFLLLYFITLIGANINSLYWSHTGVSAGASGALFGLMGWMISQIIEPKKNPKKDKENGLRPVYIAIVLGIGGLTLLMGIFNNSNNAAHLGGLAIGLFMGLAFDFYDWLFSKRKRT